MSDSDEDLLPDNVFTFQNNNKTITARGPNVNSNMTGLRIRNNTLTSSMHMTHNNEGQGYGGFNFDQRRMYSRRGLSPMSLRSVPDMVPTFNRSTYNSGTGSQRSIYNRRHGSPMSLRSIDTTTSVSAADIVFAFKNVKFNKRELQIIKDAYNKLIKSKVRKRVEKRRNLKLFLKRTRNSDGDSGEQGSDSSLSSDDGRSVKTTTCKENIPALMQMRDLSHYSNSTIMRNGINHTNLSSFTSNITENPMFVDRTESLKRNSLRNMLPVSKKTENFSTKQSTTLLQEKNQSTVSSQNISVMSQKERFKKGFQLPSQRFNQTTAGQAPVNNHSTKIRCLKDGNFEPSNISEDSMSSEEEEIFKGFPVNERGTENVSNKRPLNTEENSSKKRSKLNSATKLQNSDPPKDIPNGKSNDFIFAKPKMPIRKVTTKKDCVPEKLLAKSRVPPIAEEINFDFEQSNNKQIDKENTKDINDTETDITHTTDSSMRPSFIRRKLYTQKLDVADNKNTSSDSLGRNSPQNIYSASMRERNKARKLVTSQSCLMRDVTGADNNVLDLLHKIDPEIDPDQINSTNIANKTKSRNNKCLKVNNAEKWDVTAAIENCDSEDASDTFTDEEIFKRNGDKKIEESTKSGSQNTKKGLQTCSVVIQKLRSTTIKNNATKNNGINSSEAKTTSLLADKDTIKRSVAQCVKSFWDTDFESDMELDLAPWKNNIQQSQETAIKNKNKDLEEKQNGNNNKISSSKGILTFRNFHLSTVNNKIKSSKSSGNKCLGLGEDNSAGKEKCDPNIDNNNKETSSASQTVNDEKSEDIRRKSKVKGCVDCGKENPNTSKKANNENRKGVSKSSPRNGKIQAKILKESKNLTSKQANQDEVIKSGPKNKNELKESVRNVRIQPKRKSKDKSSIQTPVVKTKNFGNNNKTSKAKDLESKNTSINNLSTIMTRFKHRMSFDLSQDSNSSTNTNNLSSRSLRLQKRLNKTKHS